MTMRQRFYAGSADRKPLKTYRRPFVCIGKITNYEGIMKYLPLLGLCCLASSAFSQNYSWDGKTLLLNNGSISRRMVYDKNRLTFTTHQLLLKDFDKGFINKESPDFSLLANDRKMDGLSAWTLLACESAQDSHQGQGATIKLKSKDALEVDITYLLYPELPLIKSM